MHDEKVAVPLDKHPALFLVHWFCERVSLVVLLRC
jgi:hypothetical protein